ncbi:MAG: T9SS type A sorting domain-containing protein [Flavobacteriales bacterium]|nr:T9SS type A sorting domain-containing protein [Flavobacteriales bacterium]
MIRALYLITISLLCFEISAQERITPLTYDLAKKKDTEERSFVLQTRTSQVVELPFIDDFSQDHFPGNQDGNTVLWDDLNATIHTSFGIDPPSLGVAVFDGMDENGQPYDDVSTSSNGHADVLTSAEMDLEGKLNVVLSFFYQPEGYGEAPEPSDSLVLQFYDPTFDTWTNRWHATGTAAGPYIPVFLSVGETYLQNGFKFRFRNYGRLTGALDQWSIDWVYLDENRSIDDEAIADVGFFSQVNSILSSDYVSIPWTHFTPNASQSTIIQKDVVLRNNRTAGALISESGYTVEFDGSEIASFTDSQSPSIPAESNEAITQEINLAPNSFVFPTNVSDTTAEFEVEFEFQTSPDLNPDNNRMSFKQTFKNYYAYDDGQADNAYGIQNFNGAGRVAFRFDILETDTVKAIDIFFLYQGGAALEDQLYFLTVWEESSGGAPSDIIYQDFQPRQVEFNMDGGFVRNVLQDTLVLEGDQNYFIGWVQPDNTSLNIGNDLSAQMNSQRLYFDIGNGFTPSSYEGTIMIRPVFPPLEEPAIVGIHEGQLQEADVWPNPAREVIRIRGDFPQGSMARLFDLKGRMVASENILFNDTRMDVSFTSEGLYLLEISAPTGARSIKKIVINR